MDLNVGSDVSNADEGNSISTIQQQLDDDKPKSHLPSHFSVMQEGSIYDEGEESFMGTIAGLIQPYGIHRLISKNSHKNQDDVDERVLSMYPRKRFTLVCGSCKVNDREDDNCTKYQIPNPNNNKQYPMNDLLMIDRPKIYLIYVRVTTRNLILPNTKHNLFNNVCRWGGSGSTYKHMLPTIV